MANEKLERNIKIYYQVKTKVPYLEILKEHNLKSKKSIYVIYKRIDARFKSENKKLST